MKTSQLIQIAPLTVFALTLASVITGCNAELPSIAAAPAASEQTPSPEVTPQPEPQPEPEPAECAALAGRYKLKKARHELIQEGCLKIRWISQAPGISIDTEREIVADGLERELPVIQNGARVFESARYEADALVVRTRSLSAEGVEGVRREVLYRSRLGCKLSADENAEVLGKLYLVRAVYEGEVGQRVSCEALSPM